MKNGDQTAYPISEEESDRIDSGIKIYTGLTKREVIAKDLMAGILSGMYASPQTHVTIFEQAREEQLSLPMVVSKMAIENTDALLEMLKQTEDSSAKK